MARNTIWTWTRRFTAYKGSTTLSYCIFPRTLWSRCYYYHCVNEETFTMRMGKLRSSLQCHEAAWRCSTLGGRTLTPSPPQARATSLLISMKSARLLVAEEVGIPHNLHEVRTTSYAASLFLHNPYELQTSWQPRSCVQWLDHVATTLGNFWKESEINSHLAFDLMLCLNQSKDTGHWERISMFLPGHSSSKCITCVERANGL